VSALRVSYEVALLFFSSIFIQMTPVDFDGIRLTQKALYLLEVFGIFYIILSVGSKICEFYMIMQAPDINRQLIALTYYEITEFYSAKHDPI
jgi:hypothetical protein